MDDDKRLVMMQEAIDKNTDEINANTRLLHELKGSSTIVRNVVIAATGAIIAAELIQFASEFL